MSDNEISAAEFGKQWDRVFNSALKLGFPKPLLKFMRDQGIDPAKVATAISGGVSADELAAAVGYDGNMDPPATPDQTIARAKTAKAERRTKAPASAPQARRPVTRGDVPDGAAVKRRENAVRIGWKKAMRSIALVAGFVSIFVFWRIDGWLGIAWARTLPLPGLAGWPNPLFWPVAWTWLIHLGISAVQAAFWPHGDEYDEDENLIVPGSTAPEITFWLLVFAVNVLTSMAGLRGVLPGVSLFVFQLGANPDGWDVLLTAIGLAVALALYPEWATRYFLPRMWVAVIPFDLRDRIADAIASSAAQVSRAGAQVGRRK